MKNSSDTIGNQTRDCPVCGAVPQPLRNRVTIVLIVQEGGWAPGPVWTSAENLASTGIRSPYRPAYSQSLYQLSYPDNTTRFNVQKFYMVLALR
jgi:hypothetical protein